MVTLNVKKFLQMSVSTPAATRNAKKSVHILSSTNKLEYIRVLVEESENQIKCDIKISERVSILFALVICCIVCRYVFGATNRNDRLYFLNLAFILLNLFINNEIAKFIYF